MRVWEGYDERLGGIRLMVLKCVRVWAGPFSRNAYASQTLIHSKTLGRMPPRL